MVKVEKYFERRKILFLFGFLLYLNRQNDKEGLLHKKIDGFKRVREKLFTSSGSNNNKTSNLFIHDKKFQKSCSVVKSKFKNHLFLTQRILRHHCCTHLDTLKFKIRNISLRWRSKNFIILIDHFTFFPGNCWIDFGDFYENLK